MSDHGGVREGAGRPISEPNHVRRAMIGEACDALLRKSAEEAALAHEPSEILRAITSERDKWLRQIEALRKAGAGAALRLARVEDQYKQWAAISLAKIERNSTAQGFRRIRLVRQMTRKQVIAAISDREGISPRSVRSYWTEYHNFRKWAATQS